LRFMMLSPNANGVFVAPDGRKASRLAVDCFDWVIWML